MSTQFKASSYVERVEWLTLFDKHTSHLASLLILFAHILLTLLSSHQTSTSLIYNISPQTLEP
jgi:hypothetical protein